MNTQDLINFIKQQTGRRLAPSHLTRYINKGVLTVERTYLDDTGYFENEYGIEAANQLCNYIRAYSVTRARHLLSNELGINVTWYRMDELCARFPEWVLSVNGMTRIPVEHLPDFASVLKAEIQPAPETVDADEARAVVEALQCTMTLEQIASAVKQDIENVSLSGLSHMKAGRRAMGKELYDKLVSLRENML